MDRKLRFPAAYLVFLCCAAAGQTAGGGAPEEAAVRSSANEPAGTATVVYADAFPGAPDGCVQINAAIKSLHSTGGVVDARGIRGTSIKCSIDPFSGVRAKGGALLLGAAIYLTAQPWTIPANWAVTGAAGSRVVTAIKAGDSFPTSGKQCEAGRKSCPVIVLGRDRANPNVRVERLAVDCNRSPNSTGIYNSKAQEHSGAFTVTVRSCQVFGLDWEGTGAQNSGMQDITVNDTPAPDGSTVMVEINGVPSFRGLSGATLVTGNTRDSPYASIGLQVIGNTSPRIGGNFSDIHCEHVKTCVSLEHGVMANVNHVVGHPTVANLVTLDKTIHDTILQNLVGNTWDGVVVNTLVDNVFGSTYSSAKFPQIGFYSIGEGEGANKTRVTSIKTEPAQFQAGVKVSGTGAMWTAGSAPPEGSCANGSLYSNTAGTAGKNNTLYVCESGNWKAVTIH
jgi:hypothetical protein